MKIKSKIIVTMLLVFSFLSILPSQKVYAHDTYFLRVLINESTMQYEGRVEFDDESFLSSESKHSEQELGNFYDMKGGIAQTSPNLNAYTNGGSSDNTMMFSFPSVEVGGGVFGRDSKNHATDVDRARAMEISNVLIPSLNGLLATINDGKSFLNNKSEFSNAVDAIISASNGQTGSFNNWTLTRNTTKNTIKATKANRTTQEYVYRVKKGYNSTTLDGGKPSPVYNSAIKNDATYMTIGMIASQGMYAMTVKNQTLSNLDEINEPNLLDKMLGTMLVSMVDALEMMLGLYTIDELVFNRGARMEYGSYKGVMKNGWMDISTSFFMIFQVVAWSVLGVALLKALLEKNLSTMSIVKQISLMSSVQSLLIAGFLMTVFFVVVQTLITMNARMVGIFSSIAPQFSHISTSGGNGTTIADGLLRFYYFIISIYLNFTYIMRAITIAVLIAAAPIFIASIAFSSRGSELFSKWARELIANLFLQTFHAFVMGMLLMVQVGATGIEMAVIALAVIPLTKLFKSLVIGESGSLSGEMAGMASGMVGSVAAGAIGGFAAKKNTAKGGAPGYARAGASQGESDIPDVINQKNRMEHSVDKPSALSTESVKSKYGENYGEIEGQENSSQIRNRYEIAEKTPKTNKEKLAAAVKIAGKTAMTGGKYAGAGLATIAGAAMMSTGATQAGGKLIGLGVDASNSANQDVASGVKSFGEPISNAAKRASNNLKDSRGIPDEGTLMGSEIMDNGDIVNHRSLSAMKSMGIEDAYVSGKEQAITYNPKNMNEQDRQSLYEWESLITDPEDRKRLGVDNVVRNNDGTTTMFYTNYGKKTLGVTDIYKAKNRIVETKNHRHDSATQYIYSPRNITPIEDSGRTEGNPRQ